MGVWAVCLVVAACVVWVPGGLYRFVLPKLALAALGVALAVWARPAGRLPRPVPWLLVGGGAWLAVCAACGAEPLAQLAGRWPRYEGLVALPVYAALVWAGARLLGPGRPDAPVPGSGRAGVRAPGPSRTVDVPGPSRTVDVPEPGRTGTRVHALWAACSVASVLLGAVSLAEAAGLRPLGGDVERPGALLGNASDQGLLGVALLAVLAPSLAVPDADGDRGPGRRRRVCSALGCGFAVVTVVCSASRGALLGAVGAGLCLAAFALWAAWRARSSSDSSVSGPGRAGGPGRDGGPTRSGGPARPGAPTRSGHPARPDAPARSGHPARSGRPVRFREPGRAGAPVRAGLVAAGVCLLPVVGVLAWSGARDRLTGTDELAGQTVTGRLEMWRAGWTMILDHPLTGVGPSGFVDAFVPYRPAAWASGDPTGTVDSPHSWPLQAAAAGGLPLLAAALALVAVLAWFTCRSLAAALGVDSVRAALVAGGAAALVGGGIGLATHFTSAGPMALSCLMAGAAVAVGPREAVRLRRGSAAGEPAESPRPSSVADAGPAGPWVRVAATVVVGVWVLGLGLGTIAEFPLHQGLLAAEQGQVEEAGKEFALAAALRPWDGDVALVAAQSFASGAAAGDEAEARAAQVWAEQALHRSPDSLEALKASTLGLAGQARWSEALDAATRGLDRSPTDPQLHLWAGLAEANLGDMQAAETDFLQATTNTWTAADAWWNLSVLYDTLGRTEDSAQAAERAEAQ